MDEDVKRKVQESWCDTPQEWLCPGWLLGVSGVLVLSFCLLSLHVVWQHCPQLPPWLLIQELKKSEFFSGQGLRLMPILGLLLALIFEVSLTSVLGLLLLVLVFLGESLKPLWTGLRNLVMSIWTFPLEGLQSEWRRWSSFRNTSWELRLVRLVPEESAAELGILLRRMKKAKVSPWKIRLRFVEEFVTLLWVFYVRVKLENLFLPSDHKIGD